MMNINMIFTITIIKGFQIAANVATILAGIAAVANLILVFIKALTSARPAPFRRQLEYLDDFGDFLANFGNGLMTIIDFTIYYKDKKIEKGVSLVDLYVEKLEEDALLQIDELIWMTYLKNSELINRTIRPNETLKLIEINPEIYQSELDESSVDYNLLERLKDIRSNIKLEITYKTIYRFRKKTIIL